MIELEPEPAHAMLLWQLAVLGGEAFLADLPSGLRDKRRREMLIRSGLLVEQKKPRPHARRRPLIHLSLPDKGWAWLSDHMTSAVWPSKIAAVVLHGLLGRLESHLQARELVLADLFAELPETDEQLAPSETLAESTAQQSGRPRPVDREAAMGAVVAAYDELSEHRSGARVRLSELRRKLSTIDRQTLDEALDELARRGSAVLNRLDNPAEITAADRDAAITSPLGHPRHLLHMELVTNA